MAMVYQKGRVYEKGKRIKKWYGQFRLYMRDREGKEVERTRKVVLGLKSELRKYEAEGKLQAIIRGENGKIGSAVPVLRADDSVTFDWFVKEKYLPIRRGRWRPATREKTEHEINRYLVEKFKNVPLRNIGLFELQTQLNDLANEYSESVVKHAFVNLRSIMRVAQKLKFISENPGDETRMPATRPVERPTITPGQINCLIQGIEDPHDLCLMCIGLFCATRTSETFGLQWKYVPYIRQRRAHRDASPATSKELSQVADSPNRRRTEDSQKAGHVPGDAAYAGNRSSGTRNHEGYPSGFEARQHQDYR